MNWNVNTRGSSPHQGKAKIYISYYEIDCAEIAKTISDIFLKHRNCAVYYADTNVSEVCSSEKDDMLREVQCVVFPIFPDFTSLSEGVKEDYQICVSEHIPVIPILMQGAESADFYEKYQKVFRDTQLLIPFSNDSTKLPFEVQLEQQLENIITNDTEGYNIYQREGYFPREINVKIQSAFRGSIFLSYRKSDRKLARELIKTIRTDDSLTDIMVWYDEFLTVGEHYNTELRERIAVCDVFLVLGTAAALEENNYILTDEYPMASKLGKSILLVCADHKIAEQCQMRFSNAETSIRADDRKTLLDTLRKRFLKNASMMCDRPAEQEYLLGKAYLEGKLTETNRNLGALLIEKAADQGFVPAMQLMAHLYQKGAAVQVDPKKYLYWLMKAEEAVKRQNNTPENTVKKLHDLISLCCDQGDTYLMQMDMENAYACYRRMLETAIQLRAYDSSILNYGTYHIMALNKLANVCKYQNMRKQARTYLAEARNVYHTLPSDSIRVGSGLDYAETLKLLADIEKDDKKYVEAFGLYQRVLDNTEAASVLTQPARAYRLRCDAIDCMGIIKLETGHLDVAEEYFEELLANALSAQKEFGDIYTSHFVCCAYRRLGDLSQSAGNLQAACEYYIKSADHSRNHWNLEKTRSASFEMCSCCYLAGQALYQLNRYKEAKSFLIEVEKQITSSKRNQQIIPVSLENAVGVYEYLGNIAYLEKHPVRARSYYQKMRRYTEQRYDDEKTAENLVKLAAAHYKVITSHPYIYDRHSTYCSCELYEYLYQTFRTEKFGTLYEKSLRIKDDRERMIPINRSKVSGWLSDICRKAAVLEQIGLTIDDQSPNDIRIINDILRIIMFLIDSDAEINKKLADMVSKVLGMEISGQEFSRYYLMISLLENESKEEFASRIPDSIRFFTTTERSLTSLEDYHDGMAFSLRVVMYVIGCWAVELLHSSEDKMARLTEYIDNIDLYIETQHMQTDD